MSETPLSLARFASALGLTERDVLSLVGNCVDDVPDPTLVALTVEEAARRLGVGRTKMYALIASGEIPSVAIGRLRRIPAEALNAYLAARAQAAPSTASRAA
jgi:excisionase family DNA binding protein